MGASSSDTPKAVALAAAPVLLINGRVALNGSTGQIDPFFVSSTSAITPLPAPGDFALRLENAAGGVLATYSFAPVSGSEDASVGTFTLGLPWIAETKRIVLLINGTVLATRQASANFPTVTVSFPKGGETLSGTTANFTWAASDLDGDVLSYTVEYSADNGATWDTLAVNYSNTSFPVNLTKLPGSSQALIRVIVSDGFNTAQAQSPAVFTVPGHPPMAFISMPENNRLFVQDQTIILEGTGLDVEDGLLNGARLAWSSDLNGLLGNGNSFALNATDLTEGTHVITLTATDSAPSVGSATITIHVSRTRPVLPATLSVGPSQLGFLAKLGSAQTVAQRLGFGNSGDGDVSWTLSSNASWIRFNASSGTAPFNVDIAADATGLTVGKYTGQITVSAAGIAGSPRVVDVNLQVVPIQQPPLDIDGNTIASASTDGVLIARYLFGFTGTALTAGAIGTGTVETDPAKLLERMRYLRPLFDVDGNGTADALTDGVMILRYLVGLHGDALIGGAIGRQASRTTAAQVEAYLQALMP